MEQTDFSWALKHLKNGARMCRMGWHGKGMWVELQRPTDESKMNLPYLYIRTEELDLVPWVASQTDILADDWQRVS